MNRPLLAVVAALLLLASAVGCSFSGTGMPSPSLPTATAPTAAATPIELEPAPEGLEPLVPGHNRVSADRINVVLASWGWDDPEKFRAVAAAFVGWSGRAQVWGPDGLPLDSGADPSTATGADLGLFGFEPFRSRRDLFNVWLTAESPDQPYDWSGSGAGPLWARDQVTVVLALQGQDGSPGLSSAAQNQVFTSPDRLARETDRPFGNATVVVPPAFPVATIRDLPHELGHALFGFADEYVGRRDGFDGTVRDAFWPSCADGQARAEEWWSDQIGAYDDQLDYWAEETAAVGFGPTRQALVEMRQQNTTAYVADGCFGVPGSVRSAADTLMGFNFPAYGVTNRLWAQRVLDLWSG